MAITPSHPDSPEEVIAPFDLASVPEEAADAIPEAEHLPPAERNPAVAADILPLPRVVLGCATFGYGVYADEALVKSTMPLRVVRAALRAGVNAFDTGEFTGVVGREDDDRVGCSNGSLLMLVHYANGTAQYTPSRLR
jgi:hypothetical protein